MKQPKLIFFIRSYNAIDHIVPVIYKWCESKPDPVIVILYGRTTTAHLHDYRIQLLKRFDQVQVLHVDDFIKQNRPPIDRQSWMLKVARRYIPNRGKHFIRRIIQIFKKQPQPSTAPKDNLAFVEPMLKPILDDIETGLIIFDWMVQSHDDLLFAQRVLTYTRPRGFADLSLPHGDSPYYNHMFNLDDLDPTCFDMYAVDPFDQVVVPNQLCADRYIPHKGKDRVKILGSPRYNAEWLEIIKPYIPTYTNTRAEGKLKVVFFLRNPLFPVFWDEVIRTIRLLTNFPDVFLVVKHHTTSISVKNRLIKAYPELDDQSHPNLEFVYDDIHSGSLLEWADVILDLGTSVVFEAIRAKKALIAPEYLHANISTSAYYLPGTAMRCRDDLYAAIESLVQSRDQRLYTDEECDRFIQEMIDVPDENVLERYVEFLESCLNE